MKKTTTWIVAVLVVVFFIFIFPELTHLWWHHTHKEPAKRAVCMNNLRQISLAITAYTNANQGVFAQRLGSITSFCDHAKVFVCRGSGSHTGALARVDEWTDYSYRPPKSGQTNGPMVWCNPKNHRKQGASVLFQDSSIVWVLAEDFGRTIRTDGSTNQASDAMRNPRRARLPHRINAGGRRERNGREDNRNPYASPNASTGSAERSVDAYGDPP